MNDTSLVLFLEFLFTEPKLNQAFLQKAFPPICMLVKKLNLNKSF